MLKIDLCNMYIIIRKIRDRKFKCRYSYLVELFFFNIKYNILILM